MNAYTPWNELLFASLFNNQAMARKNLGRPHTHFATGRPTEPWKMVPLEGQELNWVRLALAVLPENTVASLWAEAQRQAWCFEGPGQRPAAWTDDLPAEVIDAHRDAPINVSGLLARALRVDHSVPAADRPAPLTDDRSLVTLMAAAGWAEEALRLRDVAEAEIGPEALHGTYEVDGTRYPRFLLAPRETFLTYLIQAFDASGVRRPSGGEPVGRVDPVGVLPAEDLLRHRLRTIAWGDEMSDARNDFEALERAKQDLKRTVDAILKRGLMTPQAVAEAWATWTPHTHLAYGRSLGIPDAA